MNKAFWAMLGEHLHLLAPPAVAMRVLEAARDPHCTMEQMSSLISHDPVLCGRLLRTVNSSLFALPNRVSTIDQAVRLLGLKGIRGLVLGLSLPALQRGTPSDNHTRNFWKHSVTGAIIARELSARAKSRTADEDLVAGLLRNLGMLIARQLYPEQYTQLLDHPLEELAVSQCKLEEDLLGVNHAQVSAHVLGSWGLPKEITEPIALHHQPEAIDSPTSVIGRRTLILHFADQTAYLLASSCAPTLLTNLVQMAQKHFGMNLGQLSQFLDPLSESIQEFADLLEMDIGTRAPAPMLEAIALEVAALENQEAQPAELAGVEAKSVSASVANGTAPQPAQEVSTSVVQLPPAPETLPAPAAPKRIPGALSGVQPRLTHPPRPVPPAARMNADPDHSDWSPNLPLALADHPRYRLVEMLGSGAMGCVYKAEHRLMQRTVALKVIHPTLLLGDATIVERFRREVRTAARLSHPSVVTAYDAEEAGGLHFLVMEYIEGTSLDRLLSQRGPLPFEECCRLMRQAAQGLQHACEEGMVHRDIKPPNLMVTHKHQLKILDFGIACLTSARRPEVEEGRARLTLNNEVLGTPDYLAPEQALRGGKVDIRADLYSLGCTFYFLLTGQVPFPVPSVWQKIRLHMEEERPLVSRIRTDVPPALSEIVCKLMAVDPDNRYQTPAELANALTPFVRSTREIHILRLDEQEEDDTSEQFSPLPDAPSQLPPLTPSRKLESPTSRLLRFSFSKRGATMIAALFLVAWLMGVVLLHLG